MILTNDTSGRHCILPNIHPFQGWEILPQIECGPIHEIDRFAKGTEIQ